MKPRRLLANLLALIVLVVILIALAIVLIDDKCSRAVSAADPVKPFVQEVKFK
jgi:hypothetical protein